MSPMMPPGGMPQLPPGLGAGPPGGGGPPPQGLPPGLQAGPGPRAGGAPSNPGLPKDNEVNIQFQPSGRQGLTMSVASPGGSFDVEMTMDTAAMMLLHLATVMGKMAGVPLDQLMGQLGQGGAEDQGAGGLEQLAGASADDGAGMPAPEEEAPA